MLESGHSTGKNLRLFRAQSGHRAVKLIRIIHSLPGIMTKFRIAVTTLPQILILLLLGGWLDLLWGFNHTEAGLNVLVFLFLLNPVVTLILLIVETIKYRILVRKNKGTGSLRWRRISIALFAEALVTNLFILSQLRM
jgi:hypothetical protein